MNFKFVAFAAFIAVVIVLANSSSDSENPERRNYERSYGSTSVKTSSIEEDPYINNSQSTGEVPYRCTGLSGDDASITVKTSSTSNCDVIVMIKTGGTLVRNAYIRAGGSYTFNLPNGRYQVFFYGGRGWNPNKSMPNGYKGGFVANESYSKDEATYLEYERLTYELIPQPNGNFTTRQSNANEIF